MAEIKGLIFDYGGTLDTAGDHWSYIIYDAWQKAGIAADIPHFRDAYVWAERELARTRHILPEHDFHDMLKIKMQLELQHLASEGLFPPAEIEPKATLAAQFCYDAAKESVQKAIPILKQLAKKYPLVLVSNFYGNIETVLEDFGAKSLFKKIIESAIVGVRKPDPEIFRLGCKALKLKPENVAVIGDSYSKDIKPALSLGCTAIWIKGKCWTEEEQNKNYSPTIHTLAELPGLL